MIGQYSDTDFTSAFPNASISHRNGYRTAITSYGRYTTNYWVQHSDGSWTNTKCSA